MIACRKIAYGGCNPYIDIDNFAVTYITTTTSTSTVPIAIGNVFDKGYRYGFNGMEKDKDIGIDDYDFGARIYDGRIGRWLSLDPVRNVSWSNYAAFQCSPISLIDPSEETDFYNLSGIWVGTDGGTGDKITIITEDKLLKSIVKITKKGQNYTTPLIEVDNGSFYTLPDKIVRDTIINTYKKAWEPVLDEKGNVKYLGGEHEAGTTFDEKGNQTEINQGTKSEIFLPESGSISIHFHPDDWNGETRMLGGINGGILINTGMPSKTNNEGKNDERLFKAFPLNIIIGPDLGPFEIKSTNPNGSVKTTVMRAETTVKFFNSKSELLLSVKYIAFKDIVNNTGSKAIKEKYEKAKKKKEDKSAKKKEKDAKKNKSKS